MTVIEVVWLLNTIDCQIMNVLLLLSITFYVYVYIYTYTVMMTMSSWTCCLIHDNVCLSKKKTLVTHGLKTRLRDFIACWRVCPCTIWTPKFGGEVQYKWPHSILHSSHLSMHFLVYIIRSHTHLQKKIQHVHRKSVFRCTIWSYIKWNSKLDSIWDTSRLIAQKNNHIS